MKKYLLIISLLLLFFGCINSNKVVCQDGSIVSDYSLCPTVPSSNSSYNTVQKVVKTECPFECCKNNEKYVDKSCEIDFICKENSCLNPIDSLNEAISIIAAHPTIKQEWENFVYQQNCEVKNLDIKNTIIFSAKVNFQKKLIECNVKEPFILDNLISENPLIGGITEEYVDAMKNCDNKLIDEYDKAISGYSPDFDFFGNSFELRQSCNNCKEVYIFHMSCLQSNSVMPMGFGTFFVNSENGEAYE